MNVIALYNLKGGVGKTAGTVNLAYLSALAGRRTLIWDLDPQGATTFYFRVKPKISGGRKRLMKGKGKIPLEDHIRGTDFDRLDLMPADFSYREMDVALDDVKKADRWLTRMLKTVAPYYDVIFLDCPPSISNTSDSVFHAVDALLVPMIPTTLSMRTLEQLKSHLESEGLAELPVWPFFSMVDGRKKMHRDFVEEACQSGDEYFTSTIPSASPVERMGIERNPVFVFAGGSVAAKSYLSLWGEIETRLGLTDSSEDA